MTRLLKPLAARTINGDDNLAFPSGHTAFLTAFALALALLAAGRFGLGPTSGTVLALAVASAMRRPHGLGPGRHRGALPDGHRGRLLHRAGGGRRRRPG